MANIEENFIEDGEIILAPLKKGKKRKNKNIVAPEVVAPEVEFYLREYLEKMEIIIKDILEKPSKEILTYDILDTDVNITNKLIVLKEKQRQMKIGDIWQEVLGNYNGFINIKKRHETGLDILSTTRKIIIELKNRTNTDNASAKKTNWDKLANFKRNNPDYICIYANINDDTEEKTLGGYIKKKIHNGVEIEHCVGYAFLKFMMGDDTNIVIDFVKNTINKYNKYNL